MGKKEKSSPCGKAHAERVVNLGTRLENVVCVDALLEVIGDECSEESTMLTSGDMHLRRDCIPTNC